MDVNSSFENFFAAITFYESPYLCYDRDISSNSCRRVIPMSKRKPAAINRKVKDEINKKAIIWTGSILLVVIIAMTVMIILDK